MIGPSQTISAYFASCRISRCNASKVKIVDAEFNIDANELKIAHTHGTSTD